MAGRRERLARALERTGLAVDDMSERLRGLESTNGEILSLLRTLHSEFGSHRDHAIEMASQQGKRNRQHQAGSDDATLEADIASVRAALSATATAFGVDLSKQDLPAKTAQPVR